MKYSYSWLKSLSKTQKTTQELIEMINSKGFEFESKENLAQRFEKIVVAQVLEKRKHPKADHLWLVKVNDGQGERKVVCGAENFEVGDKVPLALPGAVLPQNKIEINQRKLRGELSCGMLCAEDELGLGKDHSGIMILKKEFKVGTPLAEMFNLKDTILEFDILPNRAHDCLSYLGLAREICAMEGRKLSRLSKYPKLSFKAKPQKLTIKVIEKKLCPRYIGILMKNVKVGESPQWLKNRLIASGIDPINNVVDITNYVMLKIGNPLHAFDAEKVQKEKKISSREKYEVIVRRANKGEFLELLDGTKIELENQDLLISSPFEVLALAGIKGGKNSGISSNTSKIILEAANFDGFNIRKTRQRLGLTTESQIRFEKKISPVLAEEAAKEAVFLLKKYARAEVEEAVDINFSSVVKKTILLDFDYVESLLGEKIERRIIEKILKNLGFDIKIRLGKKLEIVVPDWRLDVATQEDLIEEIGRIYGYEKIPITPLVAKIEIPQENQKRNFEWKIKDILTGVGFFEVINYSFYGKKEVESLFIGKDHLELENPLSQEISLLRKTLLPQLLANFSKNIRKEGEVAFFEVGKVFSIFSVNNFFEKLRIGGILGKKNQIAEENFNETKSAILGFFEELGTSFNYKNGILEFDYYQESKEFDDLILEKNFSVLIKRKDNGEILGRLGQVTTQARNFYKIKENPTVFEIDFEKLFSLYYEKTKNQKTFQKISPFPKAERDVSFYLIQKGKIGTVVEEMIQLGGEFLEDIYCIENYLDPKKKKRSLTFRLVFRDKQKTLEGEKVNTLLEKILQNLEQKKEIEIRKS